MGEQQLNNEDGEQQPIVYAELMNPAMVVPAFSLPPTVSKGLFSIFISFLLFCNDDIDASVILVDRYIIGYKFTVAYSDRIAFVPAYESVVIAFAVTQSVAVRIKA